MPTNRIQIELTDDGVAELEVLMKQLGKTTLTETIRASLKITKYLMDAKSQGQEIILRDRKTGKEREIIMK